MCEEKLNEIHFEILEKMKEHVEPFISPIWKYEPENEEDIWLHGSASYLESKGEKFIITNEHVAKENLSYRFTHSFKGSENMLNVRQPFLSVEFPVDVAISKIDEDVWNQYCADGKAIPIERFSKKHDPVNGELLFFAGFSGKRAVVFLEECQGRGTPFLTQECKLPDSVKEADEKFHIAIPYPTELVQTKDTSIPLPDPHGFSGSLLWNTKFVESMQKEVDWDPSMAEVTAIVWGWPSNAVCIVATKIEHINLEEMISDYHKL